MNAVHSSDAATKERTVSKYRHDFIGRDVSCFAWSRLLFSVAIAFALNLVVFQASSFAAPRTITFYGESSRHSRFECKQAVVKAMKRVNIPHITSNHGDNTLVTGYMPNVGDTLVHVHCVPLPSQGFCGGEGTQPVFLIAGVTNDADAVANRLRNAYRPSNSVPIDCGPVGNPVP